jgi:hypothetical protein
MRGFSFVEVVVSLAIAMVVFVSIFSLATQNLIAAQLMGDRFVAARLAQEGVEIVVNKRSSNWLIFPSDPTEWRNELSDGATYIGQFNSTELTSNPSNPPLVIDNDSSLYCYPSLDVTCSGQESRFHRQIGLSTINDHQMKVLVAVSWEYNGQTRTVVVEDRLYNWR